MNEEKHEVPYKRKKLHPQEIDGLIKSFDIIGDIAIIRVPEDLNPQSPVIAEAIMQSHKHVKRSSCKPAMFQAILDYANSNGSEEKRNHIQGI
jgi:tRNA G37 N-methylase Trm5